MYMYQQGTHTPVTLQTLTPRPSPARAAALVSRPAYTKEVRGSAAWDRDATRTGTANLSRGFISHRVAEAAAAAAALSAALDIIAKAFGVFKSNITRQGRLAGAATVVH